MTLREVGSGESYIVKAINTNDENMETFLLRLGCYSGEEITVISQKRNGCVVAIKDGRYSIDKELADAILVQ